MNGSACVSEMVIDLDAKRREPLSLQHSTVSSLVKFTYEDREGSEVGRTMEDHTIYHDVGYTVDNNTDTMETTSQSAPDPMEVYGTSSQQQGITTVSSPLYRPTVINTFSTELSPRPLVPSPESDRPERMRDWLVRMIDSGRFSGLKWMEKEEMIFRVPWIHAKKRDYNQERDAALFREWAIHSGKFGDGSDVTTWKINFRCALNGLKDIIERRELEEPDCRVYQMLPSSSSGRRRKRRRPYYSELVPFQPVERNAGRPRMDSNISPTTPTQPTIITPTSDPFGLTVRVMYGSITVHMETFDCSRGCRVFYGPLHCRDLLSTEEEEKLFGPLDAHQIPLSPRHPASLAQEIFKMIKRGLVLEIEGECIYATALCRTLVYYGSSPLKHAASLQKEEKRKVFDYSQFSASLKSCVEGTRTPKPYVVFSLGQPWGPSRPLLSNLVTVTITYCQALNDLRVRNVSILDELLFEAQEDKDIRITSPTSEDLEAEEFLNPKY